MKNEMSHTYQIINTFLGALSNKHITAILSKLWIISTDSEILHLVKFVHFKMLQFTWCPLSYGFIRLSILVNGLKPKALLNYSTGAS